VIVTMKNGEEYKGQIITRDDETIVLQTVNGELKLNASNVKSIVDDTNDGKFLFSNPNYMRYFIGHSGIPLEKGEGYYQNVMVVLNSAHYGITKNISIGGGIEFFSTIAGKPIWFLMPKVGFNVSKNFHIAGGGLIAGFAGEGVASYLYGVSTFGNKEKNLSVGLGYGLFDGEFSRFPAVTLSGTYRLTNGLALVTENYIFPNGIGDPFYFGIHGLRILSRKNAFDIGAVVVPQITDFIKAIPYISYVRVF